MKNPWLTIPLDDYEGHMALPDVGQAEMLSDVLEALLGAYAPAAAAIIGCAGGNGFEAAAKAGVSRLVGLDINPAYIADAQARHADQIAGLELYCADIEAAMPPIAPVDFVYAALVFEYVDIAKALKNLRALCRAEGIFVALLQLPKEGATAVSPSSFDSLQALSAIMRLAPPDDFQKSAEALGFGFRSQDRITLGSGKQFCLLTFTA